MWKETSKGIPSPTSPTGKPSQGNLKQQEFIDQPSPEVQETPLKSMILPHFERRRRRFCCCKDGSKSSNRNICK